MRRPRLLVRALLALGCAVAVRAEAQRAPSAESVARSFLQAVTEEDWITAAGWLDLTAFRPLVELALERAGNWRPPENLTIEDLQRQDPGMPREVATWQLQRIKQSSAEERYDPLNHEFAGVGSADALRALPLDRAAAAWLAAQDPRPEIREALTRNRCPVPAGDSLARLARRELLGLVTQGDTLAWALHRTTRSRPDSVAPLLPPPGVLELRRRDGAWRIVPRYDLLGPMELLEEDLSCARPPARRVRPPG